MMGSWSCPSPALGTKKTVVPAEAFRTIRTNINYLLQGKERQTILITSDMVGAGKTFVSVNLASVFALYGKKTLLMGFDLRKPKIFENFSLTNTEGTSSFLANKSTLEQVIKPSGDFVS
jgi:Mrp family chromosome partitioning ATPase